MCGYRRKKLSNRSIFPCLDMLASSRRVMDRANVKFHISKMQKKKIQPGRKLAKLKGLSATGNGELEERSRTRKRGYEMPRLNIFSILFLSKRQIVQRLKVILTPGRKSAGRSVTLRACYAMVAMIYPSITFLVEYCAQSCTAETWSCSSFFGAGTSYTSTRKVIDSLRGGN